VSTVLRPVGPRPGRVYWIRRAVLLAIVLILVIVVAKACSGGGNGGNGGRSGGSPTAHHTTTKAPVAACSPGALKLTMSTDTKTYTSGQAPKLIGTFTNPTSTACKLARSASQETWTIKSGSPTIWTTEGCDSSSASSVPKQLKVAAGATKVVSMFWNGHLRASDCKYSDVAKAGTYRLYATLDGVTGTPAIFHITT
jgi:hypothetical protein